MMTAHSFHYPLMKLLHYCELNFCFSCIVIRSCDRSRQQECIRHQGSAALHHSSTKAKLENLPGIGCHYSRVPFFVSFLGKQKRKEN